MSVKDLLAAGSMQCRSRSLQLFQISEICTSPDLAPAFEAAAEIQPAEAGLRRRPSTRSSGQRATPAEGRADCGQLDRRRRNRRLRCGRLVHAGASGFDTSDAGTPIGRRHRQPQERLSDRPAHETTGRPEQTEQEHFADVRRRLHRRLVDAEISLPSCSSPSRFFRHRPDVSHASRTASFPTADFFVSRLSILLAVRIGMSRLRRLAPKMRSCCANSPSETWP